MVYAYRNAAGGLRGPADFAVTTAADGRYLLDLAPGRFHLVARQRQGGSDSGPPRPGDAWALPANNPLELSEGQLLQLDFVLQPIGARRVVANTLTTGPYRFSGRLLSPEGDELPDAMLLAYRQPRLHQRPDFAAPPADGNGRFTIFLPDSGPWCLVARQHTRGQLRAGELHAVIGNREDACTLQASEETPLGDIRLPPFSGN